MKNLKTLAALVVALLCCIIASAQNYEPIKQISQLSNNKLYHVSQPYHYLGVTTAWAVAEGTTELKSTVDIGLECNYEDIQQHFAFITYDEGLSYYLYHAGERMFVNKDGSLSKNPKHTVYIIAGAEEYANTFTVYFDEFHYINIGGSQQMTIDGWTTLDHGNSSYIVEVGDFDPTEALEAISKRYNGWSFDEVTGHLRVTENLVYDYREEYLWHPYRDNIKSIELAEGVTIAGNAAFSQCANLITVNIPTTLKEIGTHAFSWNPSLASINIPSGVVSIGSYAFVQCSNLADVAMPSSVVSIGSYAFHACESLTNIDLSNVRTIGSSAFGGVYLTSVNLSSATSIGNLAFGGADGIEPCFTINNTNPAIIEIGAFPANSIFIVPTSAKNTYKAANVWSDYADHIIASNLAFRSLEVTARLDKSDVEVQIGDANLSSVVGLNLKGTINSFDFIVLRNKMPLLRYLNLNEVHIVENSHPHYESFCTEDNKFPPCGLYNCKLIDIDLPQSITEIGACALENNSLNEIVIPTSVTFISNLAFANCKTLRTVIIPNDQTSLGHDVFFNCI